MLTILQRGGLIDQIGQEHLFWSSDQAIVEAENRYPCPCCQAETGASTAPIKDMADRALV